MNNNVYPFFIECSKYYQDQPYKQLLLQQFAFGRGGSFIIKRKDKNILVTPDGEFVIPSLYSENALPTCGPTVLLRSAEIASEASCPSPRRASGTSGPKGLSVPSQTRPLSIYDPAVYATLQDPLNLCKIKFDESVKKKIEDFHTARLELDQKLWKYDEYDKMQENIKNLRIVWNTTKKKDKLYLFYKYISTLELSTNEKIILCNLITLTLLLKIVKPSDLLYKDFIIQNVNQDLLTNKIIDAVEFSYDYSIPTTKIKKINSIEIEDDDEY
ncbi:MAG: hypothetical protein ACRCZ0_04080 [Cetobacterium sp.]